jgi:restriction system protein
MARSGSLAAWEQRLATQRREDDRQAREKRQRERDAERVRQQEQLASQQQQAENKTAEVQAQLKALGEVLTSVLPLRPLTFERLLAAPKTPDFDPGPLAAAPPAPEWKDYVPAPVGGLARFFGGSRRSRQTAEARARFDAAVAEYQRQEAERRRALAAAKATYDRKVTEERAKTAARNAYVTSRRSAFAAGDPEAVQWFAGNVLRASRYPDGFPRDYQVTYDPPARCLTVDLELPPRAVVPAVRSYRYVKTKDAVEPIPRPEPEITQAHERLVACVALRTLHETFAAMPPDLVHSITLTGWVATTDRATGVPSRPRLLDLHTTRPTFTPLVLDAVDPVACLYHLTTAAPPALPRTTRRRYLRLSNPALATRRVPRFVCRFGCYHARNGRQIGSEPSRRRSFVSFGRHYDQN